MTTLSETGQAIADTVERILANHCSAEQLRAAEGGWSEALWSALAESGAPQALEPAGRGDFDLPVEDALHLVRLAASHAAPVPLAETMLANWLLLSAGLDTADGVASIAGLDRRDRVSLTREGEGWAIAGAATAVPWARYADVLVVAVETEGGVRLARAPAAAFVATAGENVAREPRDAVRFEGVLSGGDIAESDLSIADLRALAAAVRVAQMCGALDAVLTMTVRYAGERIQFGKAIGKFQAVQQNIAIMGGEVAASRAATALVARGFGSRDNYYNVAAAKTRVAEAAAQVSRFAHQVHGAIGITQEYDLHFLTKRLWAWRDEFGSDAEWARLLGREVLRRGAAGMWPFVAQGLRVAPQDAALAIAAE
jgi:alkylation response protein AidB-like acyl-CoA dehydrogenase